MNILPQRRYIDIIHHESSKWANWDPLIPDVEVGDYGDVDKETGKLIAFGNIYDPDFQVELDKLGLGLLTADYPPEEGGIEDDCIISSKGAKRVDIYLRPEAIADIASASLKGQWKFEQEKEDAILIMHRPRLRSLPEEVNLDTLYKVPRLEAKWLVTSFYLCPAFFMYLSNKSGETISLALVTQVPGTGATACANGGLGWHSDASADSLFREACDETGNYSYSPLYALKRREDPEDDLRVQDAPPSLYPLNKHIVNNHLMNVLLRRQYVDIIYHESSQWANLDAPTPNVKVGDYGDVDKKTGRFEVSGNIYDPDFQVELNKLGLGLLTADYPPEEGGIEDDCIISSKGAKRVDLGPEVDIAGIPNASLKGQWQFKRGRRDALLIMHRPHIRSLPEQISLHSLNKVPRLQDKYLVTSVYFCSAFSMYLSNKSGETVSFALVAQVPAAGTTAGAIGNFGWYSNASTDSLVRAEYNEDKYSYTPLYALKHLREGLLKRMFR